MFFNSISLFASSLVTNPLLFTFINIGLYILVIISLYFIFKKLHLIV